MPRRVDTPKVLCYIWGMAQVGRSFKVLDSAEKTWAAVSDINRWVLALPEARNKGWGDAWSVSQLAPGAPVAMYLGQKLVQEWQLEEWQPPRKLRLASRRWRGEPRQSMASWIEVGVTQVSATETVVDLKLETRFNAPNFGFLLNLLIPVKQDLNRVLARMEKGMLAVLAAA